jgi:hypothetical protein
MRETMPTIKVSIDSDSFRHLSEIAVAARRPIPWQAEIMLLKAIAGAVRYKARRAEPKPQEPQDELVATR